MFALRSLRSVARPLNGAIRRFGGGGHGHGSGKVLPPKPATLKAGATLGEQFEYAMWERRNPDYEGIDAYVRYYLPHNHQVVYGILGLYASLIVYGVLNSNSSGRAKVAAEPRPDAPDYTTPLPAASGIPSIENPEWEKFIAADSGNFEKWATS